MREPTELEKQQHQRMIELFELGRKRYLDAGGDPKRRQSGGQEDDYWTEEERQEFFTLGRQVFGVTIKDGYVHCQGRSHKLPDKSQSVKNEVKAES